MPIPIISPIVTPTGVGVTRRTLWQRLARELGYRQLTTVSTAATHGEAARVVLDDELRDDEAGYAYLPTPWLYVYSGDQDDVQRRVLRQPQVGYLGNYGGLTVSRPFAAALDSGSAIAVTSPLPVKQHLGIKGIINFVEEACELTYIKARLTFTGNGTDTYDLASLPWLQDYTQTNGIYDVVSTDPTRAPELTPYRYDIIANGVDRSLVIRGRPFVYDASQTFYLDVIVRGDRLVYDGASWSYVATTGLLNDTYQVAVPEEWVVAFGMTKALAYLMELAEDDTTISEEVRAHRLDRYNRRRLKWASTALRIKRNNFPQPLPERRESLVSAASVVPWV